MILYNFNRPPLLDFIIFMLVYLDRIVGSNNNTIESSLQNRFYLQTTITFGRIQVEKNT